MCMMCLKYRIILLIVIKNRGSTCCFTHIYFAPGRRPVYPRHPGGAVPLRCLNGSNRSGIAMIAVVTQWFCHCSTAAKDHFFVGLCIL